MAADNRDYLANSEAHRNSVSTRTLHFARHTWPFLGVGGNRALDVTAGQVICSLVVSQSQASWPLGGSNLMRSIRILAQVRAAHREQTTSSCSMIMAACPVRSAVTVALSVV